MPATPSASQPPKRIARPLPHPRPRRADARPAAPPTTPPADDAPAPACDACQQPMAGRTLAPAGATPTGAPEPALSRPTVPPPLNPTLVLLTSKMLVLPTASIAESADDARGGGG